MHGVAGPVTDADRHEHLGVSIDRALAVVTLDPAVRAFEEVTFRIDEFSLGLRLGVAGCIGQELWLRHCHGIQICH